MSDPSQGHPLASRFAFPVVGIDASHDGIEALSNFFKAVSNSPGAAFVVVLSIPAHPDQSLSEALRGMTNMPIVSVQQTVRIEPDHVYIVAPPVVWTIVENELHATPSIGAAEQLHNLGRASVDEVERRRDEFLAVVSHELKHPLHLISASAELIAHSTEAHTNSSIARAADTIRRTVLGQAQIIDDLLDMSRLRTGKLSITKRPIDFKEVVQRICHTMQDEAQRKDIDFRLSVPDEAVSVNADLTRTEQIVWNLVSNALKFTEDDGKIAVKLSIDGRYAVLSVTDNGIGIDPSALPHIFQMFEQCCTTASAVRGGLGIGLSLVKDLVAIHGGDVEAHSEGIGHGATFTVKLPRIVEKVDPAPCGACPTRFLSGEKVMLVDDDRETVETFRLLLEMEGATVTVATSAEEALELLARQPPSLILSDLGMPRMSGIEFIKAVRQRPQWRSIKAIALSGFGRLSDIEEAMQSGFDGHLTKPVMLDALLSTIARVKAT